MSLRDKINNRYRVKSIKDIKDRYEDEERVSEYIKKRFSEPVGKLKHKKQVKIIRDYIHKSKEVLEVACGPGRLTVDLSGDFNGIAIDFSEVMLKEAKLRAIKVDNDCWKFKKADAFNLNINKKFDLVFSFRFIRHFNKEKRELIYKNINNDLKTSGFFILDVINARKAKWIKLFGGKKRLVTYDELYYKKEIIKELNHNGFKVIKFVPVINHFFLQYFISRISRFFRIEKVGYSIVNLLEDINLKSNPWEWIIICQKK